MKSSFISSQGMLESMRSTLFKQQVERAKLLKEQATARKADVGLELGAGTADAVSMRREIDRLDTLIGTNGQVSARIDASQNSLKSMVDLANTMLEQLTAAKTQGVGQRTQMAAQARSGLETLTGRLNETFNGEFLFAGINSDVRPLADYFSTPASSSRTALQNSFNTAFGMALGSATTGQITDTQMDGWLQGNFRNLFANPGGWTSTWSSASSTNVRTRISPSQLVGTGENANDPAFRAFASALALVSEAGNTDLSSGAYQAVLDEAVRQVGTAVTGLAEMQARLGHAKNSITQANDYMKLQRQFLNDRASDLEGVEMEEVVTRLKQITTHIDGSLLATRQLFDLSLLKHMN